MCVASRLTNRWRGTFVPLRASRYAPQKPLNSSVRSQMDTIVLIFLAGWFAIVLVVGILIFRDTKRGYGKWGLNMQPLRKFPSIFFRWNSNPQNYLAQVHCQSCHEALPQKRKPTSLNQLLWGGWTCSNCGAEVDKWGKEIQ